MIDPHSSTARSLQGLPPLFTDFPKVINIFNMRIKRWINIFQATFKFHALFPVTTATLLWGPLLAFKSEAMNI